MNVRIRPIRSEADYEAALAHIEDLMDARSGTPEGDELEVLSTLVERFEEQRFPIDLPSPVDAILFRMEQLGRSRRDLEPILGSRAKVSEVLSGKRPLTLAMIRALHDRLGIPAEALLREATATDAAAPARNVQVDWARFPVAEMAARGWFGNKVRVVKDRAEELMCDLMERAGFGKSATAPLFRKNDHVRSTKADPYALNAWCLQTLAVARETKVKGTYRSGVVTLEFVRQVASLSKLEDGPARARRFLGEHGIRLVYVPHLPSTHLDGAAMRLDDGAPVIGLTLRYDRLDNFWFCLSHELAHVGLHLDTQERAFFFDDLTAIDAPGIAHDEVENAADALASEALIPTAVWNASPAKRHPSPHAVMVTAQEIGIHPAIVAGRVRYERKNFRLLSHFVGNGQVRRHFAEPTPPAPSTTPTPSQSKPKAIRVRRRRELA